MKRKKLLLCTTALISAIALSSCGSDNGLANGCTITWVDYDGTVLEVDMNVSKGSTPSYDGATPSRPSKDATCYQFAGWSPRLSQVVEDTVYVAQYTESVATYTVTWKNYDGTILEIDTGVAYGTYPSFDAPTPKKVGERGYSYAFIGWDKTLSAVISNQTYIAVFEESVQTYTITWKNYDGSILETDYGVEYGTIPTFDGSIPTKPDEPNLLYDFCGWDSEITPATEDKTYTAKFKSGPNEAELTAENFLRYCNINVHNDENIYYGYFKVTPKVAGKLFSGGATVTVVVDFSKSKDRYCWRYGDEGDEYVLSRTFTITLASDGKGSCWLPSLCYYIGGLPHETDFNAAKVAECSSVYAATGKVSPR